ARRDEDCEPARRRHADEVVLVLELGSRGGARAEEGAPAAALHPDVVIDEAHQADKETGGEQEHKPGEAAVTAVLERSLDRAHRLREDIPEEEDKESGR